MKKSVKPDTGFGFTRAPNNRDYPITIDRRLDGTYLVFRAPESEIAIRFSRASQFRRLAETLLKEAARMDYMRA